MEIQLFGSPEIRIDTVPAKLGNNRAIAVLAYFACRTTPEARSSLVTLLWPEAPPERARHNLRHVLWIVRKRLGSDLLIADNTTLALNRHRNVQVDVCRFEALCARAASHCHDDGRLCPACHAAPPKRR